MRVCFLLVVATVAVFQASGEEKTPSTQNSSMASKDDLEERLLKKIEEMGAKLHFEILNGDRDVKDLLEDKLQDDKDELQGEIDSVQGDITNVKGDIVDMQNANSALCAYQSLVGNGNYGLSGKIIVYYTTYLETNGASCSLDKNTGKFTAGKSGVYQISVSAQLGYTKDNSYFYLYLRTSSGDYQGDEAYIAYQRADGTSNLVTPVNAIRFISLQQGETAWLEYSCSTGLTSGGCEIFRLKFCVSLYK